MPARSTPTSKKNPPDADDTRPAAAGGRSADAARPATASEQGLTAPLADFTGALHLPEEEPDPDDGIDLDPLPSLDLPEGRPLLSTRSLAAQIVGPASVHHVRRAPAAARA